MPPITTHTTNKLFSRNNIDDYMKYSELPKYGIFYVFAIFGCSAHSKNELR